MLEENQYKFILYGPDVSPTVNTQLQLFLNKNDRMDFYHEVKTHDAFLLFHAQKLVGIFYVETSGCSQGVGIMVDIFERVPAYVWPLFRYDTYSYLWADCWVTIRQGQTFILPFFFKNDFVVHREQNGWIILRYARGKF